MISTDRRRHPIEATAGPYETGFRECEEVHLEPLQMAVLDAIGLLDQNLPSTAYYILVEAFKKSDFRKRWNHK